MIKVRIINGIVEKLQHQIDSEYKDAVLSNYSHE
jgi:hypothetical protein